MAYLLGAAEFGVAQSGRSQGKICFTCAKRESINSARAVRFPPGNVRDLSVSSSRRCMEKNAAYR